MRLGVKIRVVISITFIENVIAEIDVVAVVIVIFSMELDNIKGVTVNERGVNENVEVIVIMVVVIAKEHLTIVTMILILDNVILYVVVDDVKLALDVETVVIVFVVGGSDDDNVRLNIRFINGGISTIVISNDYVGSNDDVVKRKMVIIRIA